MYICVLCACSLRGSQMKGLDPLELKFQMVVNSHGAAGHHTWLICKSSQCSKGLKFPPITPLYSMFTFRWVGTSDANLSEAFRQMLKDKVQAPCPQLWTTLKPIYLKDSSWCQLRPWLGLYSSSYCPASHLCLPQVLVPRALANKSQAPISGGWGLFLENTVWKYQLTTIFFNVYSCSYKQKKKCVKFTLIMFIL